MIQHERHHKQHIVYDDRWPNGNKESIAVVVDITDAGMLLHHPDDMQHVGVLLPKDKGIVEAIIQHLEILQERFRQGAQQDETLLQLDHYPKTPDIVYRHPVTVAYLQDDAQNNTFLGIVGQVGRGDPMAISLMREDMVAGLIVALQQTALFSNIPWQASGDQAASLHEQLLAPRETR